MNRSDQDKSKSAANLQRLYSSQLNENYSLQRQKSDIDLEKAKKLRELNFNESSFLRKYDKYVVPDRRRRRCSIDADLARAIECKYSARARQQNQTAAKYLAKDAINDECPYSLDTWNKLVDVDENIIDTNKREILFREREHVDNNNNKKNSNNDSDDETTAILDEMTRTNISLLEQGKLIRRRQTLKPIETANTSFDDNPIDEELLEIQFKQKKRGRRHSIALGALHDGHLGKDTHLKLPKINEGCVQSGISSSAINLHQSKVNSDIKIPVKKLTKNGRRLSLSDDGIYINKSKEDISIKMETKIDKKYITDLDNIALDDGGNGLSKPVPNIKAKGNKNDDWKFLTLMNSPRPVANAVVFVQEENNVPKDSMFDSKETPENLPPIQSKEEKIQPCPRIEISKVDVHCENDVKEKHVEFEELDTLIEQPESNLSRLTTESGNTQSVRSGRQSSIATAALKLLVDSHHGAAKLRYIAKLAHEMEKEELAKNPPEPEPDVFKELNKCRYLRRTNKNESDEDY